MNRERNQSRRDENNDYNSSWRREKNQNKYNWHKRDNHKNNKYYKDRYKYEYNKNRQFRRWKNNRHYEDFHQQPTTSQYRESNRYNDTFEDTSFNSRPQQNFVTDSWQFAIDSFEPIEYTGANAQINTASETINGARSCSDAPVVDASTLNIKIEPTNVAINDSFENSSHIPDTEFQNPESGAYSGGRGDIHPLTSNCPKTVNHLYEEGVNQQSQTDACNENNSQQKATNVVESNSHEEISGLESTNDRNTPTLPSITLVPLSNLIDPQLQPVPENNENELSSENNAESLKETTHDGSTSTPTNDYDNFKKPELISKKLINKIAKMDKTNIRNVINNPILKFDIALKMHAKKRLREEIRKQLRNMNFETKEMTEGNIVQPDDYIDPTNLPADVLKQFESVFGSFDTNYEKSGDRDCSWSPASSINSVESGFASFQSVGVPSEQINSLKMPLINFVTKEGQSISEQYQKYTVDDDEVCIIETPNDAVTILNDDSSNDSTSTNTTTTSNASILSTQRLQERFLTSFKNDVLPKLPESLRLEYERSTGKNEEITKIYNMCLEKLQNVPGQNEILRRQFNESSSEDALKFLLQNISDLFSSQANESPENNVTRNNSLENPEETHKEPVKRKSETLDTPNGRVNKKLKTVQENAPSQQKTGNNKNQSYKETKRKDVNKSPAKSKRKNYKGKKANEKINQHGNSEVSNTQLNKSPTNPTPINNHSSVKLVRINEGNSPQTRNYGQGQRMPNNPQNTGSCNPFNRERMWRSPGEKKCLDPVLLYTHKSIDASPISTPVAAPITPIAVIAPDSTAKINERPKDHDQPAEIGANEESAQITSTNEKEAPSTKTLDILKELDLKLLQFQEKKMEIEKKIFELQREKMEIDIAVAQLQNERSALIDSVASNPNGYIGNSSHLQQLFAKHFDGVNYKPTNCKKKKKKNRKANIDPNKKSSFAEKLKNRKKRCNRDILIEDAASTLFPDSSGKHYEEIRNSKPSEITEKVNNLFSMPTRRRPVQVVSPEKSCCQDYGVRKEKSKSPPAKVSSATNSSSSNNVSTNENLLPVSCVGESVNVVEHGDSSGDEADNSVDCGQSSVLHSNHNITSGPLKGFRLPIVKIIGIDGYILCASEDGNIYKFDSNTRQLIATFSKHTESITEMCVNADGCIYSTSLDGYMKKTTVENFGLELQSVNLHEPLQAIDICWRTAFIGSRWGNIFTYDLKQNRLSEMLCSVDGAIIALKAAKEGPRKIIIISSKGDKVHIRDASSGLLLRRIAVSEDQNIYNIALDGGLVFCGSNSNKVFVYDFTTGNEIKSFLCGNGAASLKLFKARLLFVGCYDGFIYVLDKQSGKEVARIQGAGKMILSLEIIGDKVLTSSKDNALQIIDIPKHILTLTN